MNVRIFIHEIFYYKFKKKEWEEWEKCLNYNRHLEKIIINF